ncbi:sensor histidine kinase [Sinosporangium siamense]|uniref:histidine kinase n=1 Tax=Sinosporangium siamense TaxID=1367973 RepID=A0A919RAZ5_9ACTN|nr:sensor histidine kinase [Sinosporangium siamense]GII90568.1 two-component sensor histidine kinase [Sinosporangium siamense]
MRYLRDILLVVVVATLLTLLTVWQATISERPVPVDLPLLVVLSAGVSLPLLARRVLPLTAAGVSAAVALIDMAHLHRWEAMLVTMGVFSAAVYHRPRNPGLVLAVSALWTIGVAMLITGQLPILTNMLIAGIAPVATGYALRLHRERAEQRLRLQRAETERVMAEERAWLARNVHDSVGHYLTAIRLQSSATGRVAGDATAKRALDTISELSQSALGEVRDLMRTLNEPTGTQSGVADLERLAAQMTSPGRRIGVHHTGAGGALPPTVDQTAYRVVQEALTNVARHSDATEVAVYLRQDNRYLRIEVLDNGGCAVHMPEVEGQGIRGMRERVRRLDGTLSVGPTETGGWRVWAELPKERTGW